MFVYKIIRDAIKFRDATMILLIAVLLHMGAVEASLSVPPRDITAKVGANIDFQCNTMSTSDVLVWKKYGPHGTTLYDGSSVPDPRKFSANKNGNAYSLTVFNVSHADGATYSFTTSSDNSEVFANLLVVASPVLSMSPSSGLQVGTVLNLTCSLVYGGPSTDYDKVRALSSTQDPQLSITVGSFTYNQSWHGPLVYQDYVTADNVTSVRSLSVNITLQATDAGSFATCSVQSTKPSYLDTAASQLIPLTGGPTLITINGSNDANYTRGTFINCTANGNPFPTVTWRSNSPSGCAANTGPQGPGYAVLIVSCSGSNTWNCSASNTLGAIWKPFSFTTVVDSSSSTNSTFLVAPSDVTAKAGSPATFQCSLPVGAKVNWFRYNQGRVLIFDGSTNTIQTVQCPSCDVEATSDGSYNFTIGRTDVIHGGTYSWETSGATVYANLVVIGDIKISVYPSSPSVDNIVTLTCIAICGVPSGSSPLKPISNDQQPRYNMIYHGSPINSTFVTSPPLSGRNQFLDVVTSSTIVTRKIDESDKGKNITCQVSTDIPAFSVSVTQELLVQDVVSGASSVFNRDSSFILAATISIICFIPRL